MELKVWNIVVPGSTAAQKDTSFFEFDRLDGKEEAIQHSLEGKRLRKEICGSSMRILFH